MYITNNWFWDTVIFAAIGAIAYFIAFAKVGDWAGDLGYSSGLMSLVHWALRIFLFWLIGSIVMFFVGIIRFCLSLPWWVYLIAGVAVISIIATIKIIRYRRKTNAV
ncbi:MAG: hypothetical protein PHX51_06800 [Clostridia bacterium]|nr:hypothetical protein [Clostridia bacterium]